MMSVLKRLRQKGSFVCATLVSPRLAKDTQQARHLSLSLPHREREREKRKKEKERKKERDREKSQNWNDGSCQ